MFFDDLKPWAFNLFIYEKERDEFEKAKDIYLIKGIEIIERLTLTIGVDGLFSPIPSP